MWRSRFDTGISTGRSENKYIVRVRKPRTPCGVYQGKMTIGYPSCRVGKSFKTLVHKNTFSKRLFVVDTYCGANETVAKVRFINE